MYQPEAGADGRSVGKSVGAFVGLDEGTDVGLDVRELTLPVGRIILLLLKGRSVGFLLGLPGDGLFLLFGLKVGSSDALEGFSDGRSVGKSVGAFVGLEEGSDVVVGRRTLREKRARKKRARK